MFLPSQFNLHHTWSIATSRGSHTLVLVFPRTRTDFMSVGQSGDNPMQKSNTAVTSCFLSKPMRGISLSDTCPRPHPSQSERTFSSMDTVLSVIKVCGLLNQKPNQNVHFGSVITQREMESISICWNWRNSTYLIPKTLQFTLKESRGITHTWSMHLSTLLWTFTLTLFVLPLSIPTGPVSPEWCDPQAGMHIKGLSREWPPDQCLPAGSL